MRNKAVEPLLRWGDVVTESQRQRLLEQTISAMRELLAMPERKDMLGEIALVRAIFGDKTCIPIITDKGLAYRHGKYQYALPRFWEVINGIVGFEIKKPLREDGWTFSYEYLETDKELAEMAERFGISAKDIQKVTQLLKV